MLRSRRFKSFIPTWTPPKYDTGCTYCDIPEFPRNKQIDFNRPLNNTAALPWKHLINLNHGIASFDDMPSKVELIPGSLNAKFLGFKSKISAMHPVLMSNMILNNHQEFVERFEPQDQEQLVMVIPDYKIIRFHLDDTEAFVERYLLPEEHEHVRATYNPFVRSPKKVTRQAGDLRHFFKEYPMERDLVAICGHTQRDIRCGVLAPMISREIEAVAKIEDIPLDVGLISHIGGHVYAGNLIYFPLGDEPIWYGRVFPDRVQSIVAETIKDKRVIKDLYRGDIGG